jgi:putative methionine-R-sulfoxide reductase with GAF domain
LAKQFGVSEKTIAGLQDPDHFPFPPDHKAALALADAMTDRAGDVSDDLFAELKRHFDDAQIIEIAAVIGVFNYFNRFNNALRMDITLIDPEVLLHRIEEALASRDDPCARVGRALELLAHGRRYIRVGLFHREGDGLRQVATAGHSTGVAPELIDDPPSLRLASAGVRVVRDPGGDPDYRPLSPACRSAIVAPIQPDAGVIGALIAESDREEAFGDDEDRGLLDRVATRLAPCLAEPGHGGSTSRSGA